MSGDNKDVTFSLTVMVNKEKKKVLFAVADNHFADILLSFLTLPLGRIIKVLEKHYKDEATTMGSLSSLYRSLANLDRSDFVTNAAKETLLNPISAFEDEYKRLKLDITDSPPAEYFYCTNNKTHNRILSVSGYYDQISYCQICRSSGRMSKLVAETTRFGGAASRSICGGMSRVVAETTRSSAAAASSDGVFTMHKTSFIISDDLQILPNEKGILGITNIFGITDMDKAEPIKVDFGFCEIMNLLKASLTSPTPLSDVILNKTTQMKSSAMMESQPKIVKEENPNSGNLSLKVIIQKSTGGVEHLLRGKTCAKAINNLYQSTTHLIDNEYFKTPDTKKRLMTKLNLRHGCISKDHILPLTEEPLPACYTDNFSRFSCVMFPKGPGRYLNASRTYLVKDDLTVAPFCVISTISILREQKIPISDVKEVELQIGLKEGLSILKASLTSTSALTDALLSHTPNKRPKREL